MERTSILLVDDHDPTRTEVAELINEQEDMQVVGQAETGKQGIRLADELHPSVIVMDIIMPGISGIEATRSILSEHEDIRVLALSNYAGQTLEEEIRQSGAMGYVCKAQAYEELIPAIHAVSAGEEYFDHGKR
jgi:two-component system invasion response regulator UvrY